MRSGKIIKMLMEANKVVGYAAIGSGIAGVTFHIRDTREDISSFIDPDDPKTFNGNYSDFWNASMEIVLKGGGSALALAMLPYAAYILGKETKAIYQSRAQLIYNNYEDVDQKPMPIPNTRDFFLYGISLMAVACFLNQIYPSEKIDGFFHFMLVLSKYLFSILAAENLLAGTAMTGKKTLLDTGVISKVSSCISTCFSQSSHRMLVAEANEEQGQGQEMTPSDSFNNLKGYSATS